MKNLFYFIVGVLFITLISATTVSVMTVKPAIPKEVIVKIVDNVDAEKYIVYHLKKGFIAKCISTTADRNGGSTLVILEKY